MESMTNLNSIHIVGIGGVGMSALAYICHRKGIEVSGSDLKKSQPFERLEALGLDLQVGHAPKNVPEGVDGVVYSSAVKGSNVELQRARELNIPTYKREELLNYVASQFDTISVAGSHGKTTTTSMVTTVLLENGVSTSYLIGGDVNEIGSNSGLGTTPWLVVESDESDKSFLVLNNKASIVTNIEADHLENYGSFENLIDDFVAYINKTSDVSVLCGDDKIIQEKLHAGLITANFKTYGFNEDSDYVISDYAPENLGSKSNITHRETSESIELKLLVPGKYNVLNAAAAVVVCHEIFGLSLDDCAKALLTFTGVARRFQIKYRKNDVTIIDDYAHLPTEVEVVIGAANEAKGDRWDKVIAVFQPHKYSRTQMFAEEFAKALDFADEVIVTNIYAAGEQPILGVTGDSIASYSSKAKFIEHRDELVEYLQTKLSPKTCILTIGAGDIAFLANEVTNA
jgi:UDP-N-acetylmuramate--alanine ligase